jgi:hypothetical protein
MQYETTDPNVVGFHGYSLQYWYDRCTQLEEALHQLLESIDDGHTQDCLKHRANMARKLLTPPTLTQQLVEALEAVLEDCSPCDGAKVTCGTVEKIKAALAAAKEAGDEANV